MARKEEQRGLARREKPVSGHVEDYEGFDADDDPDAPSEEDVRRFSEVLVKCRECGQELSDQVSTCWKCGTDVLNPRGDSTGVPLWSIVTAVVIIVILAMGYMVL